MRNAELKNAELRMRNWECGMRNDFSWGLIQAKRLPHSAFRIQRVRGEGTSAFRIPNSAFSGEGISAFRIPNSAFSGEGISAFPIPNSAFSGEGTSAFRIPNSAFSGEGISAFRIPNSAFSGEGVSAFRIPNSAFSGEGISAFRIPNSAFSGEGISAFRIPNSAFNGAGARERAIGGKFPFGGLREESGYRLSRVQRSVGNRRSGNDKSLVAQGWRYFWRKPEDRLAKDKTPVF